MAHVRFIMDSSTIKVDLLRGALPRNLKVSCVGELFLVMVTVDVSSKERRRLGRRMVGVGISLLGVVGAWSDNGGSFRVDFFRFMARLVTSMKLFKPSHLRLRTESDRLSLISKTSRVHSTMSLML